MSSSHSGTVIRSDIRFEEKDQALRDDVRRLGRLVGDLVREQGGEALFDLVEAARLAAISHREGDDRALDELRALLTALSPKTAGDFIRAFSTYFQMINITEKVHRIRRRRAYLQDTKRPQRHGFVDTLRSLEAAGVGREEVEAALARISIEPIFTVQLTEVTRRTLLDKQQRIARYLIRMLDPYLTRQELNATLGQIRLEMTTGWQTEEQSQERRSGDEGEHVLFFLTDVLYPSIPAYYEGLEEALGETYGESARRIRLPVLVRFGSWVGGDMDRDPSVTAKSIRESLVRHRALVLNLYYSECRELARLLSQSDTRVGVAPEIIKRSELYAAHFPKTLHSVPARHRNMPYRVFLRLIAARLQATFDDAAFPYESSDEFIADIELIADSLRANRGQHAGLFAVTRLLRRARTFGFHMATMDIRQSGGAHGRVVAEGLDEAGWDALTDAQAAARVRNALDRRRSPLGQLSSEARRTLAVFQSIAHCRRKYGRESIGPYIISMAHDPVDVLSVLLLARWGHLGPKNSDIPIDVAPCFETVADLANVGPTMAALFEDERYRRHLAARGDHQIVMLGYGDRKEDGGVVAAFWEMHKAHSALVATCRHFGIRLTLFHGRGGPISRAGRRLHEAILSLPRAEGTARLRMTEQGERINAKYGLHGIALRTLEQTTSALLDTLVGKHAADEDDARWSEVMDTIAEGSREAYRSLIRDSERFEPYFRAATPIDAMERLGMGSVAGVDEDAQAVAADVHQWEFAWTQNRCLMPGWYGFGAGVERGIAVHGEATVAEMFGQSGVAGVLLADVELTLAKADLDIAGRYSELAGDLHDEIFPLLRAEYDRSVALVLRLSGQRKLLETADPLRRAIRLRNPYVDPMSHLQVDFLRRWRQSDREDDDVLTALQASINGIAHGMQNTG